MSSVPPPRRRGGVSGQRIVDLVWDPSQVEEELPSARAIQDGIESLRLHQARRSVIRQQIRHRSGPRLDELTDVYINENSLRAPRFAPDLPTHPGDGFRALLLQTPGIWGATIEESLRSSVTIEETMIMFDELMREWLCRRVGWMSSLVLEDLLMREMDDYLAGYLIPPRLKEERYDRIWVQGGRQWEVVEEHLW
ncbi:uncharacterized protein RCO7_04623 [Rhynchosporium graminicola]|uniref:Uncharacterized protein n=1 Tax=Rhynchosporium graminicola TaxID=2792576 RepID=A0A1E1JTF4_9HELO|nr:uncharacterized protein RCO7_04623 [Rhynchosporium commune]